MNVRPEDELIYLSCLARLSEARGERLRYLSRAGMDWGYILRKSQIQGVVCLVYHRLLGQRIQQVIPAPILDSFKNTYYANASRNTMLSLEAKMIIQALNSQGIKSMMLKGLFLAEHVYKNIALRPIADIDILCESESVHRINKILNSLSYITPADYQDSLLGAPYGSINTYMYTNKENGSFVHLHWHLINCTWPLDSLVERFKMGSIWSAAVSSTIDSIETSTLAPHHQLIYLALHYFNHCFDRLLLCADILRVLEHYKDILDWELVREDSRMFGVDSIVYYSLYYISLHTGYTIKVLERLKPAKDGFSKSLCSFLMHKNIGLNAFCYLTYLSMQENVTDKIKFIRRTIVPPRQVMAHGLSVVESEVNASHYCKRVIHAINQLKIL